MNEWNVFSLGWREKEGFHATVRLPTAVGTTAFTWSPAGRDGELEALLTKLKEYIVSVQPEIVFPVETEE